MLALNTQLAYKRYWPSNVSQDSTMGHSSSFDSFMTGTLRVKGVPQLHESCCVSSADVADAGMLKVEGLLQSGCRMWDTPGVPHHFQLSSKLTADEVCLCTLCTLSTVADCRRH